MKEDFHVMCSGTIKVIGDLYPAIYKADPPAMDYATIESRVAVVSSLGEVAMIGVNVDRPGPTPDSEGPPSL